MSRTITRQLGLAALLLMATSCSKENKPGVNRLAKNAQFSGFLKDYSQLKPVAGMEDMALGYAATDAQKNLHKYIAVVVDPVEVYLASDADDAKLTDTARAAATEYFRAALVKAVSSAYPVVDMPGPLVMRLRSAIVGVDFGGEVPAADRDSNKGLTHTLMIGKVRVEMELIDSQTGDRIAALVDQQNLGEGAEIGSVNFGREERWAAAREAFDGWAFRVRNFLNASTVLSEVDLDRAVKSYHPYGSVPASNR